MIIIDCDPGHDDAVAILTALNHANVLGITTVAGNAPLSHTTANALSIVALAGTDTPVFAGADRALAQISDHAPNVHGASGLDGVNLPAHDRQAEPTSAVDYLIEASLQHDLWLVPIGPLTNIAQAIQTDPGFAERIAGVSLMGGSTSFGNVTATAEFNIWADPEAADIVFRSGITIKMCGLNLTHQLMTNGQHVQTLESIGTAKSRAIAQSFRFLHERMANIRGVRQSPLHDPCAVLALTHPELLDFEPCAVSVELTGAHTRGMTVVDQRRLRAPQPNNAEVAFNIEAKAAMDVIIDALR